MVEIAVEPLIVLVRNDTRKPSTMSTHTHKQAASPAQEMGLALDDWGTRAADPHHQPDRSDVRPVRHRTTRTCVSWATFLGLAFTLIEAAEKRWRSIRGADKIERWLNGMAFKDGAPVQDDPPVQQKVAA